MRTRSQCRTRRSMNNENGDFHRICGWADNQSAKSQMVERVRVGPDPCSLPIHSQPQNRRGWIRSGSRGDSWTVSRFNKKAEKRTVFAEMGEKCRQYTSSELSSLLGSLVSVKKKTLVTQWQEAPLSRTRSMVRSSPQANWAFQPYDVGQLVPDECKD